MRVSQASEVLYGTHAGLDAGFTSVSTDSRTIQPGALFVALRGEKFDGHDFIAAVARSGAAAAMVDARFDAAGAP
ncbi:MAG: UDP-N-acetylmuramoyl-tripeptide--D-alanyl-D-alanine ligase, partial [Betaproteobacteria bacterium]|nr:UDP-N-acetylmuramoyl-tripeptide--D-alanyl-D-alanine ligase [Betaproteobacteria bacterium]